MSTWLKPIRLQGQSVSLQPLELAHRDALLKVVQDDQLWKLWFTSIPNEPTIDQYLADALNEQQTGRGLPFVVILNSDQSIVGTTRFCHADTQHKRLELGYTWYAKRVQRTAVNTECKLLLLQHAFNDLGCIAVELRTHWLNHASRQAIARLGAKQDGILRNHRRMPDGSLRDTVVFSITDYDWPAVQKNLLFKLDR